MASNDLLYQTFEQHLLKDAAEDTPFDLLAIEIVIKYVDLLAKQGVFVPLSMRSHLETDLIDEVMDMIRKKTYGSHTVAEFRLKNQKQAG